jgi:hypothetical protein
LADLHEYGSATDAAAGKYGVIGTAIGVAFGSLSFVTGKAPATLLPAGMITNGPTETGPVWGYAPAKSL